MNGSEPNEESEEVPHKEKQHVRSICGRTEGQECKGKTIAAPV